MLTQRLITEHHRISWLGRVLLGSSKSNSWPLTAQPQEPHLVPENTDPKSLSMAGTAIQHLIPLFAHINRVVVPGAESRNFFCWTSYVMAQSSNFYKYLFRSSLSSSKSTAPPKSVLSAKLFSILLSHADIHVQRLALAADLGVGKQNVTNTRFIICVNSTTMFTTTLPSRSCLSAPTTVASSKSNRIVLFCTVLEETSSPASTSPFLRRNLNKQWMYGGPFCVLQGKTLSSAKCFTGCRKISAQLWCLPWASREYLLLYQSTSLFFFSCIAVHTVASHIFSPFFTALWHPFPFYKYDSKAALFLWPQQMYADTCRQNCELVQPVLSGVLTDTNNYRNYFSWFFNNFF